MAPATKKNTPLVPKLRFSEFVGAGEWERSDINSIATLHKGKGVSKVDIVYDGKLPCIRYGELYTIYNEVIFNVISKTNLPASTLFLSKENDIVIPASGETKIDIATAACVMKSNIALGGDLNVVRSSQNGIFLSYYLNGKLKKELAKKAQGDAVVHLYASQIGLLSIAITSSAEQQRIADCLTSLDENITAESHKLEALTAHKKALMQKLFPAEGEKVPALRFKAFTGAGGWKERSLGELCSITTGKLDANAMIKDGQYRFYTCAKNYYFINDYAFDTEALLISGNGANLGYIHHYKGKFNAYQRTYVLDCFSEHIVYIKFFLDENLPNRILSEKKDGNTPYIVLSTLSEMSILLPHNPEQQRIADCLTSLDEYITAQGHKIALLKEHKKGLMQQLFPCIEEENV